MSSTVAATVRTARIRQIQKYMKIHDEEFDANLHRLGSLLHNISNKVIGVNRAMSKVGYTSQFWGKLIILNEGTCPMSLGSASDMPMTAAINQRMGRMC